MKKLSLALVCLCAVFVAAFAGYRSYHLWSQNKLMRMAHEFAQKGDLPNAMLSVRDALDINPHNPEACRFMAEVAELAHAPVAVEWRKQVLDIQPEALSNRLALIQTAIAFNDVETARKALDGMDAAGKQLAVSQQLAGVLDLAGRQLDQALAHFQEALRLEPTNPAPQLDVALVQLQMSDPAVVARGRAALQGLAAIPAVRCEALRQLAGDALRQTNLAGALAFSRQVLACTNASFDDRLRHLELLRATADVQQATFLKQLQGECTRSSANANALGRWMLSNTKLETTLAWVTSLPAATRTNLPVPLLEADCRMLLKDWVGMTTNMSGQNWGELECMRLAGLARAYKELGQATTAKTEWIQAVRATDNSAPLLEQLMRATTQWQWTAEQEDVLWAIVNHYPDESEALRLLMDRLYSGGRTRALLGLYAQASRHYTNNLELKNNLAMTALLLEAWEKKPHELAREVYEQCPTNATYISTYAYSQLLQKRPAEALKLMQQIPSPQLETPGLAAYYGVILDAAGHRDQAMHFLDVAAKAKLLPEEQKLVDQARRPR